MRFTPKPNNLCATKTPILPKPTIPMVLSSNSTPVNLLLFHCPFFKVIFAGTKFLAVAKINEIANSAAEVIFEVGALTTITPFSEATFTSTLSKPTPALAITFKFLA